MTKSIAISKLLAHPGNPNVMSEANFRKLVRNIEQTGRYEPIVVRPHPKKKGYYQIINGHNRARVLKELGRKSADCIVWDADDEETLVYLATLNRLCGRDALSARVGILKRLMKKMAGKGLAKLLPATASEIERLTALKLCVGTVKPQASTFAMPLVFFVTAGQNKIIEEALGRAGEVERAEPGRTKAQQRAGAVTRIAEYFLGGGSLGTD